MDSRPSPSTDDSTPRVTANGVQFAYLSSGPEDGPLVLCLHGFPDTAQSFRPLLERLAAAGYHAVAPYMRGYVPSGIPARAAYGALDLGRDALALIKAFGAERAFIVGHDWGAVAGYAAAGLAPEAVPRLVVAAVPHLRRFMLRPTPQQLQRSRYMLRFQWPGGHAWLGDPQRLAALVQEWSPDWIFTDGDLAPVLATLRDAKRRRAVLGYYRALPKLMADVSAQRVLMAPVPVTTRVIYGADDGCIGREMFLGQEHLFMLNHDQIEMPGVGHFMHCEAPQLFADHVLSFLQD
ncbi:MAG: alpha/beta hydrolase [Pseudomonadota bacterium]|nr:alpha/beta hydrolase [Pseudomonadota bacterium]